MEYEIIISSKTPEPLIEIITKYWILEKGEFKYLVEDFSLNQLDEEEILKYSHCIIKTNPCPLCVSVSTITVNDRNILVELFKKNNLVCDNCKLYSPNNKKVLLTTKDVNYKLGLLTEEEYIVLRGIVRLKTKFLIYRHIFNNNIEDEDIWNIINKLQKLGLVWIARESESWKIKSFNFNPELKEQISELKF